MTLVGPLLSLIRSKITSLSFTPTFHPSFYLFFSLFFLHLIHWNLSSLISLAVIQFNVPYYDNIWEHCCQGIKVSSFALNMFHAQGAPQHTVKFNKWTSKATCVIMLRCKLSFPSKSFNFKKDFVKNALKTHCCVSVVFGKWVCSSTIQPLKTWQKLRVLHSSRKFWNCETWNKCISIHNVYF